MCGEKEKERQEDLYICLRDDWQDTVLQCGDIVQLVGDFPVSPPHHYVISNEGGGYILVNPDHLISSTTVSTGIQCARQ